MKISDFVRINIGNETTEYKPSNILNNTSAALLINYLDYSKYIELKLENESPEQLAIRIGLQNTSWEPYEREDNEYLGDTLNDIAYSYFTEGGIDLIVRKLIFLRDDEDANDPDFVVETADERNKITLEAIKELPYEVINVQLAYETFNIVDVGVLLDEINKEAVADRKILYVTTNIKNELISKTGLFIQYYDKKAVPSNIAIRNRYESAAAMAYFSKIDYWNEIIKDYEFTDWKGSDLTRLNIADNFPEENDRELNPIKVNIFTHLINRHFVTKGLMTDGIKLMTYYFEIVIAKRATLLLMNMLFDKVNMNSTTYVRISNELGGLLSNFTTNELFDRTFVNDTLRIIDRDGININAIEVGERLQDGFKVIVLPATRANKRTRVYDGIYIYFAINNQISEIQVSGQGIGGL